jgi:hypothetical protein
MDKQQSNQYLIDSQELINLLSNSPKNTNNINSASKKPKSSLFIDPEEDLQN